MLFITIAAELGVRSKDICNLKLSDIDWELCSISFVQSKTGKPNTLPLSEKKWDLLLLTTCIFVRKQNANTCLSV